MDQDHVTHQQVPPSPYKRLAYLCFGLGGIELLFLGVNQIYSASPDCNWHLTLALFGLFPGLMGLCLLLRFRWSIMVAVGYGTIGLALDISTLVHSINQAESMIGIARSLCTGVLGFCLILFGGQAVLKLSQNGQNP